MTLQRFHSCCIPQRGSEVAFSSRKSHLECRQSVRELWNRSREGRSPSYRNHPSGLADEIAPAPLSPPASNSKSAGADSSAGENGPLIFG